MAAKTVEEFVELKLFAIQFRDSSNNLRDCYALKNEKGKLFLLDIKPKGGLMDQNPLVPELKNVEKLQPVALGGASLCPAPKWISEELEKNGTTKTEEPSEAPVSPLSEAAALGEEDDEDSAAEG